MVHPAAWVIEVLRFGGRGKAALVFFPSPGLRKGTGSLSCGLGSPGRSRPLEAPPAFSGPPSRPPGPEPANCPLEKTKKGGLQPRRPGHQRLGHGKRSAVAPGLQARSDQGVRSGSSMWAICLSRSSRPRSAPLHGIPHRNGSSEDPLQRLEGGEELFRPDRPPLSGRELPPARGRGVKAAGTRHADGRGR
jgi:hypothetical protein